MKKNKIQKIVLGILTVIVLCWGAYEGVRQYNNIVTNSKAQTQNVLEVFEEEIRLQTEEALNEAYLLAEFATHIQDDSLWFPGEAESLLEREEVCLVALIREDQVVRVEPKDNDALKEGENLKQLPDFYSVIKRSKAMTVVGPYALTVDGKARNAFYFLQPVLIDDEYAGVAVVALEQEFVVRHLKLEDFNAYDYDYQLWMADEENGQRVVISTSAEGADFSSGVRQKIDFPEGWVLTVKPRNGWIERREIARIISTILFGEIMFLLFVTVSCLLYVRTKTLKSMENLDMRSGFYNSRGFIHELSKWLKVGKPVSVCYFVYEGQLHFKMLMSSQERDDFMSTIPDRIREHVQAPTIIGRSNSSTYFLAIQEKLTPQELDDIAKDISISLMVNITVDGKRYFITPRYECVCCRRRDDAQEVVTGLTQRYYAKYHEESPIHKMAETCRELSKGNSNVSFDETADFEFMELSKAFNQYRKVVEELAYKDPNFHVGNRPKFLRDVNMLINYNKQREFQIFCLDICEFSQYNELFNVQVGDEILAEVIRRLEQIFGNYLYRVNGDVFLGIYISDKTREKLTERILKAMEPPVVIDNADFDIKVRISICAYPGDGERPEQLLEASQSAMRYAKSSRESVVYFNENLKRALQTESEIIVALKDALAEETLELWYQPVYSLEKQRFIAAEALMRLPNGSGGYYPADVAASLAERSGMAEELGDYVLRKACKFIGENEVAQKLDYISVNMSVQQLVTRNSGSHILKIIQETGVSPTKIVLEITESMLMQSMDIASSILEGLRQQGVRVALDDFGMGYSSLNYLSQLPTDIIKIDRTFSSQLIHNEKQRVMAKAIASVAHFSGLCMTMEGIETKEELAVAAEIGSDNIQGYYFAKPMSQENVTQFLKEQGLA